MRALVPGRRHDASKWPCDRAPGMDGSVHASARREVGAFGRLWSGRTRLWAYVVPSRCLRLAGCSRGMGASPGAPPLFPSRSAI